MPLNCLFLFNFSHEKYKLKKKKIVTSKNIEELAAKLKKF